ncbi:MAG: thioredoxin family protein [Acidimicrobiales bacterium]
MDATKETFRDLVSGGLVLVDVWGPECRPCFTLMPHVERQAAERPELGVVKLEAPKARRLCMELGVLGLPAFILFHDGEEVGRLSGQDITPSALQAWLDETVSGTGKGAQVPEGGNPR